MKRMLCFLVLLVTMNTMGLLVVSKSTSAGSVLFAGMEQVLHDSNWEGTWIALEYGSTGRAELSLTIIGDAVVAEISIYESGEGDYTFSTAGTVSGNTMELETKRGVTVLSLTRENGELWLRGDYKVTSGSYVGEIGSYDFKIKKE